MTARFFRVTFSGVLSDLHLKSKGQTWKKVEFFLFLFPDKMRAFRNKALSFHIAAGQKSHIFVVSQDRSFIFVFLCLTNGLDLVILIPSRNNFQCFKKPFATYCPANLRPKVT